MRHACRRANRPLAQTADRVRRVALLLSNAALMTDCSGHPTSIEPVTPDTVHASLLVFPELAALATSLRDWVSQGNDSQDK